jgi:hypothetical protein
MKKISASVIFVFLFSASYICWGQINTASLTGLVTDSSGAVMPEATVTLTNTATNVSQSTTTSNVGYYIFPVVQVGNYSLKVQKSGFQTATSDLILDVGQRGRLDVPLKPGGGTETVTVQGDQVLLQTQEAAPGSVIENAIIRDVPLSARNWDDLLVQVAGVQADRYTEQGGGTASRRTGGMNVHGVRSLANNFVLDGVDDNSISENVQELTTQSVRPSVDAIQEFRVSTDPYNAENGRAGGALVSVTTKSGTNGFHGVAYEFLRNKIFDANDFFLNRAGKPRPAHVQNQFGANLGGPVLKNKMFFFFNYEGSRNRLGTTRLTNVPTANERIGDFSSAAAMANGIKGGAYSPLVDNVGNCMGKGVAFPNNQIPTRCLDPVALKILNLVPGPNTVPASGALDISNFIRVPKIQDDGNSYVGRVDYNLNSANNVFVRYTLNHRFRYVPGAFGGIVDGTGTSAFGRLTMNSQGSAIGWTSVISPTLVNDVHIGWNRNYSVATQDPFELNKASDFVPGTPTGALFDGGLPGIVIQGRGGTPVIADGSGLGRLGSPDFLPKSQITNQFEWADSATLSHGTHEFKVGIDAHLPMRNIFIDVPSLRGTITFDGQRSGIGLADFLLGYPSAVALSNPNRVDQRIWMLSEFAQDSWKMDPKLTLTLGLRYDYATWPHDGANRMTNLDPTTGQTFTTANSPYGNGLISPDRNNFAPRVGAIYQLTPNTVIRSGYGRFYQLFDRNGSEDQLSENLPWLVNNNVSATDKTTTANGMILANGFNLSLDPNSVDRTKVRVRAIDVHAQMPQVDQWNLGIQHMLPGNVVLTTDYVGTKGTYLAALLNLNQQFFTAQGAPTGVIPFPALGPVEFRSNVANSSYNGLEMTAEKRYGNGMSLHAAYTYSHSIDNAAEQLFSGGSNSFMQNSRDFTQQRGSSDFDVRHRLVFSYVFESPFGPGRKMLQSGIVSQVLRGWRLSGLTALHSGRPFTMFDAANNSAVSNRGGLGNAVADCNGGNGSLPRDQQSVTRFFDTTQFAAPPAPRVLGNCRRNSLEGPNYSDVDFALARSFNYFGNEQRSLEFRWEVFNALNTPQFGLPVHDVSNSSNGQITSLAGDPRVMQFALKFYF